MSCLPLLYVVAHVQIGSRIVQAQWFLRPPRNSAEKAHFGKLKKAHHCLELQDAIGEAVSRH